MYLYHRTPSAKTILKHGFRDHDGTFMTSRIERGVWLSNVPLDANEGAHGEDLLQVRIPLPEIRKFEWIEEGKPYREFLVPARMVNRYPVKQVSELEEERRQRRRWRRRGHLGRPHSGRSRTRK